MCVDVKYVGGLVGINHAVTAIDMQSFRSVMLGEQQTEIGENSQLLCITSSYG